MPDVKYSTGMLLVFIVFLIIFHFFHRYSKRGSFPVACPRPSLCTSTVQWLFEFVPSTVAMAVDVKLVAFPVP